MDRLSVFLLLVCSGPQLAETLVFEIHIRVVEGRTATLPCRAPNMVDPVKYLEWSRPDQNMAYIYLYRDPQFYLEFQDRAFKDRVDLLDRQMKEGEVSLVLRNVTPADSGVYECRVVQAVAKRPKRAVLGSEPNMIVKLRVSSERQIYEPDDGAWVSPRRSLQEEEQEEEGLQQYLTLLLPVVAVAALLLALTSIKLFRSLLMKSHRPASK